MSVAIAEWLVRIAGLYALAGVVFAIPFVFRGAGVLDPLARRGSIGFRILIFPGSVALWPLLLRRWVRKGPPPTERNAHRRLAGSGDVP